MIDYSKIATAARKKVLELIFKAGTSHIGSCFSAIDIMTVLFEKADPKKDEIILSAGWKAAAWYYFLWRKGIITENELNSFCKPGSPFIGLVEPLGKFGLKVGTGSMGMGLPFAVGFALAKKMKGEDGKVYVLLSDGECQIGTFYESILIAKQHNLNNLIVLIDNNLWQAMGRTKEILNIEPLQIRLVNFEWVIQRINGHDFEQIENALKNVDNSSPNLIICDTIKGSGGKSACNIFEDKIEWHYRYVDEKMYKLALVLLSKEKV